MLASSETCWINEFNKDNLYRCTSLIVKKSIWPLAKNPHVFMILFSVKNSLEEFSLWRNIKIKVWAEPFYNIKVPAFPNCSHNSSPHAEWATLQMKDTVLDSWRRIITYIFSIFWPIKGLMPPGSSSQHSYQSLKVSTVSAHLPEKTTNSR